MFSDVFIFRCLLSINHIVGRRIASWRLARFVDLRGLHCFFKHHKFCPLKLAVSHRLFPLQRHLVFSNFWNHCWMSFGDDGLLLNHLQKMCCSVTIEFISANLRMQNAFCCWLILLAVAKDQYVYSAPAAVIWNLETYSFKWHMNHFLIALLNGEIQPWMVHSFWIALYNKIIDKKLKLPLHFLYIMVSVIEKAKFGIFKDDFCVIFLF